jgi:hypothetical protein
MGVWVPRVLGPRRGESEPYMNLDLTDGEAAVLAQLLRHTIDESRYPLSPLLRPLKAILATFRRKITDLTHSFQ